MVKSLSTALKRLFTYLTSNQQGSVPTSLDGMVLQVANLDVPAELVLPATDIVVIDDWREDSPPKTVIVGNNVVVVNNVAHDFPNSIRGTIYARNNITLEDMCDLFTLTPPVEPGHPYKGGGLYAGGNIRVGTSSAISGLYHNVHPATQVHGNIVAGGDVHIGDNVAVHGWVIAGGNVYIGDNCTFSREIVAGGNVYIRSNNVRFAGDELYRAGNNGELEHTSKIIEQQPNQLYGYPHGISINAPKFPNDFQAQHA